MTYAAILRRLFPRLGPVPQSPAPAPALPQAAAQPQDAASLGGQTSTAPQPPGTPYPPSSLKAKPQRQKKGSRTPQARRKWPGAPFAPGQALRRLGPACWAVGPAHHAKARNAGGEARLGEVKRNAAPLAHGRGAPPTLPRFTCLVFRGNAPAVPLDSPLALNQEAPPALGTAAGGCAGKALHLSSATARGQEGFRVLAPGVGTLPNKPRGQRVIHGPQVPIDLGAVGNPRALPPVSKGTGGNAVTVFRGNAPGVHHFNFADPARRLECSPPGAGRMFPAAPYGGKSPKGTSQQALPAGAAQAPGAGRGGSVVFPRDPWAYAVGRFRPGPMAPLAALPLARLRDALHYIQKTRPRPFSWKHLKTDQWLAEQRRYAFARSFLEEKA